MTTEINDVQSKKIIKNGTFFLIVGLIIINILTFIPQFEMAIRLFFFYILSIGIILTFPLVYLLMQEEIKTHFLVGLINTEVLIFILIFSVSFNSKIYWELFIGSMIIIWIIFLILFIRKKDKNEAKTIISKKEQ